MTFDVEGIAPYMNSLFVHVADAFDTLRVHLQVFQRLTIGPVAYALLRSTNNGFCCIRHADKRRAAAFVGNGGGRTAHIDIEAVESKLADDVGSFIEVFRPAAEI